MRPALVLHSPRQPSELLRTLASLNLWRDSSGSVVAPYFPGSRHIWAKVHRDHFRLYMRSIRINTFAPVLTGTITSAPQSGSIVRANFRFTWNGRIFLAGASATMAWILGLSTRDHIRTGSLRFSPRIEAVTFFLFLFIIVSPLSAGAVALVRSGFLCDHIQDRMGEELRRIISDGVDRPQ
jgi:hypothetical protein